MKNTRERLGLPYNDVIRLEDGRFLVLKYGKNNEMICRQKGPNARVLLKGETVYLPLKEDNKSLILVVQGHKGKNVIFKITGIRTETKTQESENVV